MNLVQKKNNHQIFAVAVEQSLCSEIQEIYFVEMHIFYLMVLPEAYNLFFQNPSKFKALGP